MSRGPAGRPEPGPGQDAGAEPDPAPDFAGAADAVEKYLLGGKPRLTRVQVAEAADVPLDLAEQLWRWLGFPHASDTDVAFTQLDVEALRQSKELVELGILGEDRQAALVRTWGRSFARLAEWQTTLLADLAMERGASDPVAEVTELAEVVLPRVEALQGYVWRRHLASAASRLLVVDTPVAPAVRQAVVFVDIVGYTSRSKSMDEVELVAWLEEFEDTCADLATDHGGRIIKNIGDEVLVVVDDPVAAAEMALEMVDRGADDDDPFPQVRAGLAYGDVVARLGDVYGPTVNIASRLTSLARPSTVLVDRGAYEVLSGRPLRDDDPDQADDDEPDLDAGERAAYSFRRVRRASVKGYARLQSWRLRHY